MGKIKHSSEFEFMLGKIEELKMQLEYQTERAAHYESMFHAACKKIPADPGYENGAKVTFQRPKKFNIDQ